jgi:hypothetical protein
MVNPNPNSNTSVNPNPNSNTNLVQARNNPLNVQRPQQAGAPAKIPQPQQAPVQAEQKPRQQLPPVPQILQQTPVQPKGPTKMQQIHFSQMDPNLILETPPPKRFEPQTPTGQGTETYLGKRGPSQIYKSPIKKKSKHIQCTYASSHKGPVSDGFTDEGLNSTGDCYIFSGYAPNDYVRAILTKPQYVNKIRIGIPKFQGRIQRDLKKINMATVQICKGGDLEDLSNWMTIGQVDVSETQHCCEISIKTEVKAIQVTHADTMGPGDSIGVGQFAVLKV